MNPRPDFESLIPRLSFLDDTRKADQTARLVALGQVVDQNWSTASNKERLAVEKVFKGMPEMLETASLNKSKAVVSLTVAALEAMDTAVREELGAPVIKNPSDAMIDTLGGLFGLIGESFSKAFSGPDKEEAPFVDADGSLAFQAFCEGYEQYADGDTSPALAGKMAKQWDHLHTFAFDTEENSLQLMELFSDGDGSDYARFVAGASSGTPQAILEGLAGFSDENPLPRVTSRAFGEWKEKFGAFVSTLPEIQKAAPAAAKSKGPGR